ncbi:MAG: hypothetical protein AT708_01550 [Pyrobaculum sp. OCT_11]|jgi:hypothetical protein|nr:MAG: hypothetical protein AT708_01550 [Pyrobaculum sp. OCT_11]
MGELYQFAFSNFLSCRIIVKAQQYLPALIWYLQRRGRSDRGVVIAVRTKDICGVNRRCGWALRRLMMSLVAQGLASRHKQGVYLIKRESLDRVLLVLRKQI